MKKRFIVCIAAVAAVFAAFGASAKKGSCLKKAISLKSSQSAKLVEEYDPEEKEFLGDGVAYYTVTLKRGVAYTIWITGGNASSIDLDVDTHETYYEDREDEPGAGFDIDEIDGGSIKVAYLYADDWDLEEDGDPKSGKYQVTLTGNVGATTTLGFATGIRTFTKVGSEESPKALTMGTSLKTFSGKLVDGEYHFRASLKAGRKYRIRTVGGTKTNPLTLSADGVSEDYDTGESTDTERRVNAYNDASILVPDTNGKYEFVVSGNTSQSFKFQYQLVPSRKITAHPSIPLLEENGYSAKFVPGRIADTHDYYDVIIDEHLCKMYLNKGESWAFETEGAGNAIQMVAYNSSGTVIASNDSIDGESFDTRVVINASAAGVYYVGVCDPALDVDDAPSGTPITLTARDTSGLLPADSFDPVDDVYATATQITPYPATTNESAVAYTLERADAEALGAINGPHRFSASDLYDVFAFPCRKGYTYKLRASFADQNETSRLALDAKLFNIRNGKEVNIAYTGTVSPAYADDIAEEDLTFKATTNAVHYLRVWVADGKGLDFPAYNMHVIGGSGTNENVIGLVRVVSKGAPDATWSLNGEKFAYPSGSTLAVPRASELTITANAISGFKVTSPANTKLAIPAWKEGATLAVVTNVYSDSYDSKDATSAGAVAITPKATVTTLKRTLWKNDAADYFSFTAAANVYYNFKVESTLADGSGDAVISILNAAGKVLYTGPSEITRAIVPSGVNYVSVTHGTNAKADSAYALSFSKTTGGVVRFTNAKGAAAVSTYMVKEGSKAATLYVHRTGGAEGAMRVRYATQAGTAHAGANYCPVTDGEISWAAGDKAVKEIQISLIPDAVEQWESSDKKFTVRLYPVSESELADDEYPARISSNTATVTIKEASAKKPGTVSLASYGADDTAVPNVKKPAVTGTAGQALKLTFTRTDGKDGPISIKVASPTAAQAKKNKDTALVGKDYAAFAETLKWANGDEAPKTVTVNLLPSSNYSTASKKFIFTITAIKAGGVLPELAAKTATLTIQNDTVAQTAAVYAKTIPAATGLKLASTGTWFSDYDGTLRSASANGTLTYTLTGPGFFACEPSVVLPGSAAAAKLSCQFVNKTAKLNETVTDFTSRLVRIVPAGTTTVKFTLSGVKGGAYVKFAPQTDGTPYVWTRFSAITPAPMDKAVVSQDVNTLAWAFPDALAAESGLYCRVRFGTAAKPVAPTDDRWYDKDHNGSMQIGTALVAGKTYYWTLDYAYTAAQSPTLDDLKALNWTSSSSIWSFSIVKPGAPITSVNAKSKDAAGNAVADLVAAGQPVELIQCVRPNIDLDGTGANHFQLLGGTLPKGVKINASTGALDGAPTTPGTYTALLQSVKQTKTGTKKVNGKKTDVYKITDYGTTVPVTFNVLPAGTMIGSFRGVLQEANGEMTKDARRLGLLTLTTTAAGKITAKATIGGIAYTFSGTAGFDSLLDRDETLPGCTRHVQVKLKTKVQTLNNKKKVTGTYTDNYLTLTLGDGALTNAVALAEAAGTAELTLNVLNSAQSAVKQDVDYTAVLYRNNGATELGAAALAPYEGYYTAALAPKGITAADGIPAGNGYLTFTVAKTGAVKVAGSLADGTAVSFSTIGQPVGDTLAVPVFVGTAAYVFGGDVKIAYPAGGEIPVVLPSSTLLWEKNAAKDTSEDGTAFAISVAPTGGWYDKIVNLQNYYANRGFAISSIESGDELPAAALAKGYSFSTLSTPNELEASFVGNSLAVSARKLVNNKTTGLADFGTSVNPWNTTVKLNRATGLVSGTFNAWEWVIKNDLTTNYYATAQTQISSLAHKGVLLYARDDSGDSPLAENVLTAGYFLMPATTSTKAATKKAAWKASLPFNILTVEDRDIWNEKEF